MSVQTLAAIDPRRPGENARIGNRPIADLVVLGEIVRQFDLQPLVSVLRACSELASDDSFVDVAVLGQFKSGKSSLLNAILGTDIFPVGALPATAVVTRASFGPSLTVRVRHIDGSIEPVEPQHIAEFVTETGNPNNRRLVEIVDVFTPALRDWPGIRLVDTPGLGSAHVHNSVVTKDWLPNAAVALVVVSVERPLADEDRRLLADAQQYAARTVVVLTKVDLLSAGEHRDVLAFVQRTLSESSLGDIPVMCFSIRTDREQWIASLKEIVLARLKRDLPNERRQALAHKKSFLTRACRSYLAVGLSAAQRTEFERARLRDSVLNETVKAELIREELRLAKDRSCEVVRPAFEKHFFAHREQLVRRLTEALQAEWQRWSGNLARQTQQFEFWMADQINATLTPLAQQAAPLADQLLGQAEERFRRIVEAFRDRLSRNVKDSIGIEISPASWEVRRPIVPAVPVNVGRTFMAPWEMLWWLLPMRLVGGMFRRHIAHLVPWEVEKNLTRLAGDCATVTGNAIADLHDQAAVWIESERTTLDRLLRNQPAEVAAFHAALERLRAIDPITAARPES